MRKGFIFLSLCSILASSAFAANGYVPKRFNTVTSHDDVYPYRLNNAQPNPSNKKTTSLNTSNSVSGTPIGKRNVAKRQTRARTAGTVATTTQPQTSLEPRRVVQRTTTPTMRSATTTTPRSQNGRNYQPVASRTTPKVVQSRSAVTKRDTTVNYTPEEKTSSKDCFANYKKCMEGYCQREDTPYNRCYCSAKLSQIDSKYQDKIDSLIQEIVKLRYTSSATTEDIKEYWNKTVGQYTDTNPWVNIENALNIDWADSQSRVRGQTAFNTGHEYCVQYLNGCYYMASNMRNAYKSEIARDCDAYEKSLQRIQNAAESVIKSYK